VGTRVLFGVGVIVGVGVYVGIDVGVSVGALVAVSIGGVLLGVTVGVVSVGVGVGDEPNSEQDVKSFRIKPPREAILVTAPDAGSMRKIPANSGFWETVEPYRKESQ
jgi:hypothetical protein